MKSLLIFFLLISLGSGLSENFQGIGQINAWHDGDISDRAVAIGIIEYGAEKYDGGFSSGLNITGTAKYSFRAGDYSVRLDDFNGSIVAESDNVSTTVDGNGTGSIRTKSLEGSRMGVLVSGFPTAELNFRGVGEIHTSTTRASVHDPMETNTTADSEPHVAVKPPTLVINRTSEVPL